MRALVFPHVRYHRSFLEAMAEFADEGRAGGDTMVGSDLERYAGTWGNEAGFASYVEETLAEVHRPRHPGFVTSSTWWWVEAEEYVGRICVRHRLTEHLREVGGHIGYDVRRSRRREGHGTAMLAAVLPEAAGLGIDPALVTCDTTNLGSRRVIEANGGVQEDERNGKCRYWIPTRSGAQQPQV